MTTLNETENKGDDSSSVVSQYSHFPSHGSSVYWIYLGDIYESETETILVPRSALSFFNRITWNCGTIG